MYWSYDSWKFCEELLKQIDKGMSGVENSCKKKDLSGEPEGNLVDKTPIDNSSAINDSGKRISYGENAAMREPTTGKGRFDLVSPFALDRLAHWYELGAGKYAPRNWEKGIPWSRCLDSALRHLNKFQRGMTDEDHLAAAAWNIFAIIHYQELGMTEFNDIPDYNKEDNNETR